MSAISRRRFLGLGAGALALGAGRAFAIGEGSKVQLGQLVGGGAAPRSSALKRLAWEIDKRTSIDVKLDPADVRLSQIDLYRWPMLYLAGERALVPPSEAEVARLRLHLQLGGFIVSDGAEGRAGGEFDRSVRELGARLFPKSPLAPLSSEHVVYKSFYLLDGPSGRVLASNTLDGIEHDGRLVWVHCQNDLGGAWARDNLGQWEFACFPGGERQRELAFRLGVNLVMYALCLDYKTDQVHVPFILRRRRGL